VSLKKKLIIVVLISGLLLVLILYGSFGLTMIPPLKNQKALFINKLKKKIEVALTIEVGSITSLCNDWSDWDSLVEYINKPDRQFERNAIPDEMFTDGMLDVLVILNNKGKILFYKNYRPEEGFIGFNRIHVLDDMTSVAKIMARRAGTLSGFIKTSVEPVMFVANPVRNREQLYRKEGILLMGRYVDERMLERISYYSDEKIRSLGEEDEQLRTFCAENLKGNDIRFCETEDKIMVFHFLRDINRKLALRLFTETDNRLFTVVNHHITIFIIICLVMIVFLGTLLYFSIDKYLLKRMLKISNGMKRIEGFEDLSVRIDTDANRDEVSRLITDINLTLDRLEQEKIQRENVEKSMVKQGKLASIGRLASSIAHEINNPLVAIGSSIQVLKKICREKSWDADDEEPSLAKEAMDIVESETERIREIISGLLDFHRLDKEEFSRVNLKEIILQSLSVMKWGKKLGDIHVTLELADDLFVYGAPVRLEQVFINFISNAAEAVSLMGNDNGEDGKLRIKANCTTDSPRKCAEVHFIDNGPGVPDDVKSSLFEPFVTTKEDKGVGLGLYISYKIVGKHGGEIIYDEDYKDGAHFIVRLPVDRRREEGTEILPPIPPSL
jgi:signal transduction histidine kinase